MGETRLRLRLSVEMTIYWIILLLIVTQWGLIPAAVAFSAWYFTYLPRLLRAFLAIINCSVRSYLKTLLAPIVVSLLGFVLHKSWLSLAVPTMAMELLIMIPELLVLWSSIYFLDKKRVNRSITQLKCLSHGLKNHPQKNNEIHAS